jgi:16S rRNA G966 N2-methylase RsmD
MQDVETTFASLVPLLSSTARVVYEHSSRYDPPEHPPGLELEQRRVYGDSAIALYCSSESE